MVLLWTMGSFLELITVAVQDVRASTAFIVLAQFSKTALLMGAAAIFGTVRALVIAALLQGVVQIAVMVLYLRRRFPRFWRAFDWPLLRRQGAYALPLGLSSIVIQLQDTLHHLFVSHAFGPAGYAIYSVGVTQLPLVGILRESAGAVMLPRINQLESENGRREILDLVARAARKLALVYFPLSAFLLVVGREVVVFLFTRQYEASWPIFAIAVMVLPMNAIVLDPVTRAHSERFFFLRLRLVVLGCADDRPGPVRVRAGAGRGDGRGVCGDRQHLADRGVADVAAARGRAGRTARVPPSRLDCGVDARSRRRGRGRSAFRRRRARLARDRTVRGGVRGCLRRRPGLRRRLRRLRSCDRSGTTCAASLARFGSHRRRPAAADATAGAARSDGHRAGRRARLAKRAPAAPVASAAAQPRATAPPPAAARSPRA